MWIVGCDTKLLVGDLEFKIEIFRWTYFPVSETNFSRHNPQLFSTDNLWQHISLQFHNVPSGIEGTKRAFSCMPNLKQCNYGEHLNGRGEGWFILCRSTHVRHTFSILCWRNQELLLIYNAMLVVEVEKLSWNLRFKVGRQYCRK